MIFQCCFIISLIPLASGNPQVDIKSNSVSRFIPSAQKGDRLVKEGGGTVLVSQNRVKIDVYIESQCPDTDRFLKNQLEHVYAELGAYIELALFPFGKANVTRLNTVEEDYSFGCQHGEKECIVNQLMCCGIDRLKTVEKYFPYIVCLQMTTPGAQEQVVCDQKAGLPHKEIQDCGNGREGRLLHRKMGLLTKSQHPDRDYLIFVPWVVVDGTREERTLTDLKNVICEKLNSKFGLTPEPCSKKPHGSGSRNENAFYTMLFSILLYCVRYFL